MFTKQHLKPAHTFNFANELCHHFDDDYLKYEF